MYDKKTILNEMFVKPKPKQNGDVRD